MELSKWRLHVGEWWRSPLRPDPSLEGAAVVLLSHTLIWYPDSCGVEPTEPT